MVVEILKSLRNSKKISQKDFAQEIGVAQQTVASWESGRTEPSNEALKSIADYFNVSTDYLLGRITPKAPALTEDETTVLGMFETLSTEGRNLFMGVLNSLSLTHSKVKQKATTVVNNNGGSNYGVVGGNFSSNVTIG